MISRDKKSLEFWGSIEVVQRPITYFLKFQTSIRSRNIVNFF